MMAAMRHCLLLLPCLLMLACSASKSPSDTPSGDTTEIAADTTPPLPPEDPGTDDPSTNQPEDPSGAMKLSHFETTLTIKTGTTLSYSFKSHASVGYGAEFEIGDPNVLRHLRTDTDYEQSEQERAGKTGADAATGTFVFEAAAPGTSTLKVAEKFRGSTELEVNYTITVEP